MEIFNESVCWYGISILVISGTFFRVGLLHEVQVFAPTILTSNFTSVSFAQPHSDIYSLPLQQQQHFHIFLSSDIPSALQQAFHFYFYDVNNNALFRYLRNIAPAFYINLPQQFPPTM